MQDFFLGEFGISPDQHAVVGPGGETHLEPKVMAVLTILASQPGEVVTRQHLLDTVWAGTVVTDEVVTRCISELRSVLSDNRQKPKYIQTVPKKGYRLLVTPTTAADSAKPKLNNWLLSMAAALLVALAAYAFVQPVFEEPLKTLAILPFESLTEDSESDYFGAGLAEELINTLVTSDQLKVISRNGSFGFTTTSDIRDIRKSLGADFILTGTIQRTLDRIRVAVQLVDTASGINLWTQKFDRQLADIFDIQDEIAAAITQALELKLDSPFAVARISENIVALDYYLLGRHYWHQRTPESIKRAIELFEQAILTDQNLALAHSGLADAHLLLATYGNLESDTAIRRASASVQQALTLQPELAEAHASEGILHIHQGNFPEAIRSLKTSVTLNDHYDMGLMWLGNALQAEGRVSEAYEYYERAHRLDPQHPVSSSNLMQSLMFQGRYQEAGAIMTTWSADESVPRLKYELKLALEQNQLADADIIASTLLNSEHKEAGQLAKWQINVLRGQQKKAALWLVRARADHPTSVDVYLSALEHTALFGNEKTLNRLITDWQTIAHTEHEKLNMEQMWRGVYFARTHQPKKAIPLLTQSWVQDQAMKSYPPLGVLVLGHLLLALDETEDEFNLAIWRSTGDEYLDQIAEQGWASHSLRKQEAFYYAASSDIEKALDSFQDIAENIGLQAWELVADPRTNILQQDTDFLTLIAAAVQQNQDKLAVEGVRL